MGNKEAKRQLKEQEREGREQKRVLERTVDTMFRITIPNHMQLSVLADQKANILITICAIILGLILGDIFDPQFMYALTAMALTCVVTMLLAVYATMPKLSTDLFGGQNPPSKPNLLFFGYFGNLPYATYAEKMDELLKSRTELVDSLLRDLHSLGVVLANKKYKYLRYSYLSFSIGLVITTIIFAISFFASPE